MWHLQGWAACLPQLIPPRASKTDGPSNKNRRRVPRPPQCNYSYDDRCSTAAGQRSQARAFGGVGSIDARRVDVERERRDTKTGSVWQ